MGKLSKRDHSMPGWVSHGNVQINVGRDLNIHAPAQDCDCSYERAQLSSQWASGLGVVLYNGWQLGRGIVLMTLLLATSAFSLALWAAARASKGVNATLEGIERGLGGAPNRLISAPAKLLPLLGVGHELAELDDVKRLEPDYDHTN
jgi:hypothetical protein